MTRCLSTLLAVSSLALSTQALAAAPAKHKPAARKPLVTKSMAIKAPANQPVFNPATSAVAITSPSGVASSSPCPRP